MSEAYIVYAKRTPIGKLGGGLSTVPAPKLTAALIRHALQACHLKGNEFDEIILGNVLTAGVGQAPARQAAVHGGLSAATKATTVNRVCGSGLTAIILGAQSLRTGDASLVFAGGQENMSLAPHLWLNSRKGCRFGAVEAPDHIQHDGLTDPYGGQLMGTLAELCCREYGFSREDQDRYARQSYERARRAAESGHFAREIVPIDVPAKAATLTVNMDEEPEAMDLDKIPKLRPAFQPDGTITAANASSIDDGAALVLLSTEEAAKQRDLRPIARIVAYASHSQDPKWFTTAPVGAIRRVLQKAGLAVNDIDLFEINEAFACVAMAAVKDLGLPNDRVNIHGGAVALGHPIGASGARIVVTLLNALEASGAKRGLATLCIGGGEADAVIVERI